MTREVNYARLERPLITREKEKQKIASDPALQFLDDIAETGVIPFDMDGDGVISLVNARLELERFGSDYSRRNITQKSFGNTLKALFGEDWVKAHSVRDAVTYDARSHRIEAGEVVYTGREWQRGIKFPPLPEFRALWKSKTGQDHSVSNGGGWKPFKSVAISANGEATPDMRGQELGYE